MPSSSGAAIGVGERSAVDTSMVECIFGIGRVTVQPTQTEFVKMVLAHFPKLPTDDRRDRSAAVGAGWAGMAGRVKVRWPSMSIFRLATKPALSIKGESVESSARKADAAGTETGCDFAPIDAS